MALNKEVEESMQKIDVLSGEYLGSAHHLALGLALILSVLLIGNYWKHRKLYKDFPTYPIMRLLALARSLRKNPRHLPFTVYVFEILIVIAKRFQKEGLFLISFPKPLLIVFDEEAMKVFSNEPAAINKSRQYKILQDGFGLSVATRNDEDWRKHRRLLNPLFHAGFLKNNIPIFDEEAQELVKKLEGVVDESSIDIHPYISLCTLRLFCKSIMGMDPDELANEVNIDELFQLCKELGEVTVYRMFNPFLHSMFMLNFIPDGRKYLKLYQRSYDMSLKVALKMKQFVYFDKPVIEETKDDDAKDGQRVQKSFLSIMLQQLHEDLSFTMEDLRSAIANFLVAGFDTSSHTIEWCMLQLGHHPDVQEQAYNEIQSISKGSIKYEDLHEMKYLDCIIKEILRLYPTIPIYGRNINKDVQCGKYTVPKGTDIILFPFMLHRNPEIYLDPDEFRPERFSHSDGTVPKRSSAYNPFGEGLRNCIGKRLAMMEMKVIMAHIIRKFRIKSLDRLEDIDLSWEIALCPAKHLRFQLSLR